MLCDKRLKNPKAIHSVCALLSFPRGIRVHDDIISSPRGIRVHEELAALMKPQVREGGREEGRDSRVGGGQKNQDWWAEKERERERESDRGDKERKGVCAMRRGRTLMREKAEILPKR